MPFVVREHRGGGAFTTMVGGAVAALNPNAANNLKTSPFNRFYMENIHPQLIATSSAKLFGRANLYANDTDNQTDIAMAGSESGCLLQLKNGAKLFAKFDIETAVTSLEIKGDMTVNALSLKLECGSKFGVTLNATLHTKAVFFPISWYYNITLSAFEDGSPATVDATAQKLKVMPGASLTVGKNVTLNASEVVVYDEDAIQDINDSSGAYEKKSEPSLLIINGTMTVKNLAGKVRTEMEGAKLSITDSATIATKEVSSHSGSGLSATVNYKDITTNLQLKMYAEGVVADFTQQGIGTYTSIGGGWQKQEA